MVPERHLTRIQGLQQAVQGGALIVTAPLGALLVTALPMAAVMAVDVVTALVALAPLAFITVPQPERAPVEDVALGFRSTWRDIVSGVTYLRERAGHVPLLAMATVVNLCMVPAFALLPLLVVELGGGAARRYDPSHVKSEGAGQVVLVGAPNSGKSALVATVTNARPEVAPYPYTTQTPQPAMMPFENIQIQLVDTPAISREYTPAWLSNLVRYADAACVIADAGNDACLENVEAVIEVLLDKNVRLVGERGDEVSVLDRVAEVPALLG